MNANTVFAGVNIIALVGWLLIVLAPYSRATRRLIDSMVLPVILALVYAAVLVVTFSLMPQIVWTLEGITEAMSDPWIMTLGWTHLVAFDLVAGTWMKLDAAKQKIRHRWMIVPYLLTFLLGPIGLLTYVILRNFTQKGKKS